MYTYVFHILQSIQAQAKLDWDPGCKDEEILDSSGDDGKEPVAGAGLSDPRHRHRTWDDTLRSAHCLIVACCCFTSAWLMKKCHKCHWHQGCGLGVWEFGISQVAPSCLAATVPPISKVLWLKCGTASPGVHS